MFTAEEREQVRRRLLGLAEADDDVVAAAITGSHAAGTEDEWSDVDLALSIRGELEPALERWTVLLYRDFTAVHHWDLPFRSSVYRVFLLPGWLEVDIAFTPVADFGPRGSSWRAVFGDAVEHAPDRPQRADDLVGLAWHHALHARVCIERGKPWQAEYWISGVRDHVVSLACLRLGHPARYAKGADLLPPELLSALEPTLVGSLEEGELQSALAAACTALADEVSRADLTLAGQLQPMLAELGRG